MKTIHLPCFGIIVNLGDEDPEHPGMFLGGSITSDLKDSGEDRPNDEYDAAVDGLESLVLGHAVAGVNIEDPAYLEGIDAAADAIMNHHT
jgi:hypothetical protein